MFVSAVSFSSFARLAIIIIIVCFSLARTLAIRVLFDEIGKRAGCFRWGWGGRYNWRWGACICLESGK